MSDIWVLPDTVSTQIAAGEVIERPASVVKELIENALDAGASHIRVAIERAGVKLISVIDNGSGMDADDALLCFELHGTSKIKTHQDLQSIGTYGFRGEALPSIASVSRVLLRTRRKEETDGAEVEIAAGIVKQTGPGGCAVGTEIVIKDLFYNVPARRKFLKTDATEERHIFETLLNMSLPNPQVGFELSFDGRSVLHSPASKTLVPRLQTFFGKEITREMLPVDSEKDGLRIRGWIARHGVVRSSRREQRFFVNGRAVESLTTFQGVREGYGSMIEKGAYPPVILFIDLDPALIDVNVHPAKREIRFRSERPLIQALSGTIRSTLQGSDTPAVAIDPSFSMRSIISNAEIRHLPSFQHTGDLFQPPSEESIPYIPIPSVKSVSESSDSLRQASLPAEPQVKSCVSPSSYASPPPRLLSDPAAKLAITLIGILNETYILAAFADGLVVIDQHAAHERILFEKFLRQAEKRDQCTAQPLLFPVMVELSRIEANLLRRYRDAFAMAGFEIGDVGQTAVMLNALPDGIPNENLVERFRTLLSRLAEEDSVQGRIVSLESVAKAACKAAVKAHDRLTHEEAEALIRQMGECDLPFSCPHGRPTILHISSRELDKRFGRTS